MMYLRSLGRLLTAPPVNYTRVATSKKANSFYIHLVKYFSVRDGSVGDAAWIAVRTRIVSQRHSSSGASLNVVRGAGDCELVHQPPWSPAVGPSALLAKNLWVPLVYKGRW